MPHPDEQGPGSGPQIVWRLFRLPPEYGSGPQDGFWGYWFLMFRVLPTLIFLAVMISPNKPTEPRFWVLWGGGIVLWWLIPNFRLWVWGLSERYPRAYLVLIVPLVIFGAYLMAKDLWTGRRVLTPTGWIVVTLISVGLVMALADWLKKRPKQ